MGGTVDSVVWELVVWSQIEAHIPKSKSCFTLHHSLNPSVLQFSHL